MSFNSDRNEEDLDRRINCTWRKFWAQKEILKGKYSLNMKKTIIDTSLLPSLTYGCQTWIYTNKIKNKIRTCQRAMERSILKLRKIQKIRSEDIRKKTKLTDALEYCLKLKWQWAGHLARYPDNRWTLLSTKWNGPPGKRRVGRPKKRWADEIISIAGSNWINITQDRERWKRLGEAYTQMGSMQ